MSRTTQETAAGAIEYAASRYGLSPGAPAQLAIDVLDALAAAGWSVVKLTPGADLHAYGCPVGFNPGVKCTCGSPHFHQVVAGEVVAS